jgi:glutathione synthase/RimK-type ligase-like ATP-grasp enzyme
MRIAWLTSPDMLPDAAHRRADGFELDRMIAAFTPAFADRGMTLVPVAWDQADLSGFDRAWIGAAWDYTERPAAFLAALARIDRWIPLDNPLEVVRWNHDKGYLLELADRGLPVVTTLPVSRPDHVSTAFSSLGCDRIVLKRRIGAGAHGQHLLRRHDPVPALDVPMLAQPFLPSIQTAGEVSVVVVDGTISHAVRKLPAEGDYRIQAIHGGHEVATSLSPAQEQVVHAVLAGLPTGLLYARIDLVDAGAGPALMEVELIEPYLYPDQAPDLGARLARAFARRVG